MFYGDILERDYETYRARPVWPWQRRRKETFDRIHRACIVAIADKKRSPAIYVSTATSRNVGADILDVIIDAVLAALQITGPQALILRTVIRVVLQILLASLLAARPSFGSTGDFDEQVRSWAMEAKSGL